MPHAAARRAYLPPGSPRRPVPRWVGPAAALALGLLVATAFATAWWANYQLRREEVALERERTRLLQDNQALQEELRLLHTPEYIERLAREQLGLVKPGEVAVILVDPTPAPTSTPPRRPR